jgi:NAD(P)-dependent dehydrogenase (short-subunit alcohol dehydrogenase family)
MLVTVVTSLAAATAASTQDRSVLVTGASSGIGLKMVEVLSANGFFVYAGARSADDLQRLDAMSNVKAVRLDVNDQDEIDAAVELVEREGRGLYGLFNNAGVAVVGPMIELEEDDMAFQMDVNLFGPYRVTRAFAPLLIESQGRIMTTGSISGVLSGPLLGHTA